MSDDFIRNSLKPILNTDIDDEIIQYIKQMKSLEDFEEFVSNFIDTGNSEHLKIYEQLKGRLFGGKPKKPATVDKRQPQTDHDGFPSLSHTNNQKLKPDYKKQPQNKNNNQEFPRLGSRKNESFHGRDTRTPPKQSVKGRGLSVPDSVVNKDVFFTPPNQKDSSTEKRLSSGKGRKTKYTDIDNYSPNANLRKGRHPCDCQASEHALINNCLNCGRIVCEQEGSGPCFVCDTMVCTNEELKLLESNSKQSDKLYNKMRDQKKSQEWIQALERRDKLVKADRLGEKKSRIYDDQTDYYGPNQGTEGAGHGRVRKSKRDMKIALDLASRTVCIEDDEFRKNKQEIMKGVNKLLNTSDQRLPKPMYEAADLIRIFDLDGGNKENRITEIQPVPKMGENKFHKGFKVEYSSGVKVANPELLLEFDQGLCLSMHQPWASLLVAGIKIHEGRTWYSDHRGRLWIQAGSKEPDDNEILAIEQFYRDFYGDPELKFPKKYPTSCLLGCVFVEDCLSQEKYREQYSGGESDSPYVLICHSPIILPIFYPMPGQHKIFPLTKDIHQKANAALTSAKYV